MIIQKKIIAYRIYFEEKDNLDGYSYDFHFKYWNTKCWSEKLGKSIVRHCDLDSNKDWFYDAMDLTNKNKELAELRGHYYNNYNSEIIYFQYKEN